MNRICFDKFFLTTILFVVNVAMLWGQHPYEGVWYMQCRKDNSYYMVPAANPQVTTANHVNEDAFFSSDYSAQAGDPEKPFITTFTIQPDETVNTNIPVAGGSLIDRYTIQPGDTRETRINASGVYLVNKKKIAMKIK